MTKLTCLKTYNTLSFKNFSFYVNGMELLTQMEKQWIKNPTFGRPFRIGTLKVLKQNITSNKPPSPLLFLISFCLYVNGGCCLFERGKNENKILNGNTQCTCILKHHVIL